MFPLPLVLKKTKPALLPAAITVEEAATIPRLLLLSVIPPHITTNLGVVIIAAAATILILAAAAAVAVIIEAAAVAAIIVIVRENRGKMPWRWLWQLPAVALVVAAPRPPLRRWDSI